MDEWINTTTLIAWIIAIALIAILLLARFSGKGIGAVRSTSDAPAAESSARAGTAQAVPVKAPPPPPPKPSGRGGGWVGIAIVVVLVLWFVVWAVNELSSSPLFGDAVEITTARPSGSVVAGSTTCTQPEQTVSAPADGSWSEWVDVRHGCYANANPTPDSGAYRIQCQLHDGSVLDWVQDNSCGNLDTIRFQKTAPDGEPLKIRLWFVQNEMT